MAETRRWEVLALDRSVKLLTFDRRIASLGILGLASARERLRSASKMGIICIVAILS